MSQTKNLITQDYSKIRENVIAKLVVPSEIAFIQKDSIQIENHFFYPALGGNGFPNVDNFISMLEGSIRRFSLSAKEIARHKELTLAGNDIEAEIISQQGRRFVKYAEETAKNAGEIGELALFIILEAFFNAPKIASKMKLKTSNDVHVHGSDALHAILGDDKVLNLILGESKFRNDRSTGTGKTEGMSLYCSMILHGSARTTAAVRRAIQHSQESLNVLAERHGINPKTVAKWRKREFVHDAPMSPKEVHSSVLSLEEEAAIVAFRKHTLLPLDDCLYPLHEYTREATLETEL